MARWNILRFRAGRGHSMAIEFGYLTRKELRTVMIYFQDTILCSCVCLQVMIERPMSFFADTMLVFLIFNGNRVLRKQLVVISKIFFCPFIRFPQQNLDLFQRCLQQTKPLFPKTLHIADISVLVDRRIVVHHSGVDMESLYHFPLLRRIRLVLFVRVTLDQIVRNIG